MFWQDLILKHISISLISYFSHWVKHKQIRHSFVAVCDALRDIPYLAPKMKQLAVYHAEKARSRHPPRAGEHAGPAHVVTTTSLNYRFVHGRRMWYARNVASVVLGFKWWGLVRGEKTLFAKRSVAHPWNSGIISA